MDRHIQANHSDEPKRVNTNVSLLHSESAPNRTVKTELTQSSNQNSSANGNIDELRMMLGQALTKIDKLEKTIAEKPVGNITINHNTLVYNCFDQNTIDIFARMLELHGAERAISYSAALLKGKTKDNKHNWIKNPELVDLHSLSHVIKYDANPKNKGFHIVGEDKKQIIDTDGSIVDKILTNTVVNANLKAQGHLANKASQAYEDEGDGEKMWAIWEHPSICNRRGETIHDYIDKFKKVTASKSHLIDIFSGNINE